MMLHRHFENEKNVKTDTVTEDDFDLHAPLTEDIEEAPKKRGRPKKADSADAE